MGENIIAQAQLVLAITPARWANLTTLSADLLQRQPGEGEWSALECLQHLVEVEHVFRFRVSCFQKGEDFPAFDPDAAGAKTETRQSPEELAQEFARLRKESLELFAGFTAADLERSARHAELGEVTLGQMLHEWAGHDLMHTVQGERAVMQPFINGCGAWQPYFEDHWVK